ncbi:MAG: lipid-binding SYLF domain-containing protein [Acetobacter sp.]|nr:lipid-binding SYLF domain-containing protein [Acetobacter sp.]MCH4090567.1 lipid-binding SYLF domain-containing protein [Acetobacter sp.]MCI1299261.1 lipid-binding SYLF domain-containing protein [Acetobacter sp.]MCI1315808.1 lipid-binding SYLF domain-containing protein [Acetobacter sp.]
MVGIIGLSTVGHAADNGTEQTLVDKATLAVQDIFTGEKTTDRVYRYLNKSRAVMVCPSIFRMSIGIGGSGGGCLLLSRDARGSWSDPAFYRFGSGSIGLQLGVQSSSMMFFVMSDRGLQALLDSQFQFGANAAASFATMGSGIESGTAGRSNTDIMALQKSEGLFAGVALSGAKLTVDSDANRAYYNQIVGPTEIVISMRVNNAGADPLRAILTRYSASATAAATANPVIGGSSSDGATSTGDAQLTPYNSAPVVSSGSGIQSQSLAPIRSQSLSKSKGY